MKKVGWAIALILLLANGFFIFILYDKDHERTTYKQPISTVAVNEPQATETNSAKNAETSESVQEEQSESYVFRKANWGMSVEEVKQTEDGQPIHEQEGMVIYNINLAGYDVSCSYLFTDEKLFRGAYMFNLQHTNENDYITDYDQIKAMMIEKYGNPKQDEINWKNDLYKSEEQQYGFAVSLGHLVYYAIWETKDTDIILELKGDNYSISVQSSYWSKDIEKKQTSNGF